MNEIQKVMNELGKLIEDKEVLIRNQGDEIQSLKRVTKECYKEGFDDGMNKAWSLAQRIVHREWIGDENIHTVEDWFELLTVHDALQVMNDMYKNSEKPHWKKNIEKQMFECSECGYNSFHRFMYCPQCGNQMNLYCNGHQKSNLSHH